MKNAEAKGEEGEVDEAQELFQQAEALQQTKASLEAKALQVMIAREGRREKEKMRRRRGGGESQGLRSRVAAQGFCAMMDGTATAVSTAHTKEPAILVAHNTLVSIFEAYRTAVLSMNTHECTDESPRQA